MLQATGWYGLRDAWSARIRAAARALSVLFAINMVLFVGLETAFVGRAIATIAFDLALLFVSGIVGAIAVMVAVFLTLTGGTGRPSPVAPGPTIGPVDRGGPAVAAGSG